ARRMGWRASRGAGEGTRRADQDDPEAVGKAWYSRPRHAPAIRDDVRGRVRGDALAPQGAVRADARRARGQVRPQLEARMMSGDIKTMNMIEAINSAMDVMLERDPATVVMGEDVGYFGGVFRATAGLQKKHGKTRVFDTPINECGIIGVAVGMGAYGLRPVPEIQFADYIYPGLDQLVSEAARLRYRSANDYICPMTVRTPFGGGIFGGQTHSQSPESIMTHICGVKTVIPSNPYDAKGLLIAAIEDNDPVVFLEPKRIYNGPFSGYYDRPVEPWSKHDASAVPEGYYRIDLGKAATVREG